MTDPTVTRFPGVFRRTDSAVFWFGLRAPVDLQHHYPGPWAVRQSLGTKDIREANDLARALHAEWAERFAAQRKADNPTRVAMNPALAATIAAELRRWVLEADDNMRDFPEAANALLRRQRRAEVSVTSPLLIPVAPEAGADPLGGLSDDQLGAVAQFNADGAARASVDMAARRLRGVLPLAEAVAASMGLLIDWETPEGRTGLTECLKAHRQACEDTMRRDAGDVIETPSETALPAPPQAPTTATKGHTARDAFGAWKAAKPGRPRKTEATYEAAANKLTVLMGGKTLEELTRVDGRAITAGLLEEAAEKGGSAQNTAANLLGRFKTLLAQAVDLEWIDRNPLDARTIERVKRRRKPWLPAELVILFDDPLFNAYDIPRAAAAGKDAAYWLPLLGLFTGARISELAQMHTDDVSHLHEAGWVLSIEEDAEEGQRVKNAHSIRTVPVHPELVRLGFIDYWKAIKAHGSGALWPAIVRTELNGAGGKVSQWFGGYKKAKGFGPEHVFHSFRHTLETQLRALSVPKYHIGAITGHAGEDVSDEYAHPTPAVLRPVLQRLQFPELVLPRVFKSPAWRPAQGDASG